MELEKVITADTILQWLKKQVEQREVIDPDVWIDAAMKLNMLIENETDILFTLGQTVKEIQLEKSQEDKQSVSSSKLYAETTDEYRLYKQQEAKVERIQEAIRLAKIQARHANDNIGLKNL
jgi:hypothetical protein